MIKFLKFYVSDFWIWAGITFGVVAIISAIADAIVLVSGAGL
jgi:F0F1-type ATP synthase membrane subunit c/vacuolar-type H+-ATPase subunit K